MEEDPAIALSIDQFRYIPLAFVILAILLAIIRTYVRVFNGQRRVFDDYILLPFACLSLIASWILMYLGAPKFYSLFITLGRFTTTADEPVRTLELAKIADLMIKAQPWYDSFAALNWASIFAVKFCYLYFFRPLIDRQGRVVKYWKLAIAFIFVAGFFVIFAPLISCPHVGQLSGTCARPSSVARARKVVIVTIVVDVITDLMIIAIPIYLMYKVQLRLLQKLGICSLLCLSAFMIIIALMRVTRINHQDFTVWAVFWQQIEACVAVLMISLTAFRTLFVMRRQSPLPSPAHSRGSRGRVQQRGSPQGLEFLTVPLSLNDHVQASEVKEFPLESVREVHLAPEKHARDFC